MSVLKGFRARLRAITGPRAAETRMEEEFRFHVEMETKRLVRDGVSQGEAHRRAMIAFGGLDQHREAMRDGRGARVLDDLWADVRYAFRSMRRSPGFAIATALTLGIGVGVNGLTFSYVNTLMFRPMPAQHAEQLVGVFTVNSQTGRPGLAMYEDYTDLRDKSGIFQDVAGRTDGPLNLSVARANSAATEPTATDMVWGEFVTENYFTVLGTRPAVGRFFTASDAPQGANKFAVLSYDSWHTRFNEDPAIVGRVVRLNGTEFTVTGVAPNGFRGVRTLGFWPDVWVPIGMHKVLLPGSDGMLRGRGDGWMMLVGRMQSGWTTQRTAAAVRQFAKQLEATYPATNRDISLMLVPAESGFDHPAFVKPRIMQLASALGIFAALVTLLIICANLANLQLARSKARAREIAIRLSLGCSRARLTRQLLVESLLLAIPGTLLAAGIVYVSPMLERFLVPQLQFRVGFNPTIDFRVVAYTTAVALIAVTLFGLAPALRASRPALTPSLARIVGSGRFARRGNGLRTSLVVSQLALSVMLLVAGTLFVRSMLIARAIDVGFDADNRVLLSVNPGLQGYDVARGQRFYQDVVTRISELPGVESSTWAFPVPFDTYGRATALYVDGVPGNPRDHTTSVGSSIADRDFVRALGLRLQSGRTFSASDTAGAPLVMVVSNQLAQKFWPGKAPIGQHARLGGASGAEITVVGVVADARFAMIGEENQQRAYLPLRQNYRGWLTLVVHTSPGKTASRDVRAAIAALDPTLPTFGATTMRDGVANGFTTNQTAAGIGGFFGLMSLLIASIGLYAVVAGSVTERTREIGVRMALGATPRRIMQLVMQGGARMALFGIGIGLVGALFLARAMRGLLYGLSASDPLTFVLVPVALMLVVFLATWLPARRAVRMTPIAALRND